MSQPGTGGADNAGQSAVDEAVARFERAWREDQRPDLGPFLPADGPTRLAVLVGLAHVDLECRLKAGEPARVEDYLRRYPELAEAPAAVSALAAAEYRLRRGAEPGLTLTEYLHRFPHHRGHLARAEHTLSLADGEAGPGAAPAEAAEWPTIPGYRILGELGRGGMGVVYQAWQESLDRPVALKVVLAGEYAGPEERRRFRAEAEAAARLHHPNIVQIYEAGEHLRRPFLCMEQVDGTSLAERGGADALPPRAAAGLVEALARAVQHAHERGIVHRDLKPANVLLAANGTPKITDFGLAKRLDRGEGQTQSGAILGTPGYMAPEQAAGRSKAIGPAADVYALGAILYELLTGRPPFRGDNPLETLHRVLSEEPCPPRRHRPGIPADLEAICLQCLRKDPARRYGSAGELADDLGRFLGGKPVRARPPAAMERLGRWARRREVVGATAGGCSVLCVALLAGILWSVGWSLAGRHATVPPERAEGVDLGRDPPLNIPGNGFPEPGELPNVQAPPPRGQVPQPPDPRDKVILAEPADPPGDAEAAGAGERPQVGTRGRDFVRDEDVLQAIRDHLDKMPQHRRRTERYFSLANVSNDPEVSDAALRLYRAALSKAVNSLSWEPNLVIPRAIDRQGTVFVVDTHELGWDRRHLWDAVLSRYPYGLTRNFDRDEALRTLSLAVTQATGTDLPCVRADWFVARATRPPLYHDLLDLPRDVKELEKRLNVDVERAFLDDALVRAGIVQSGASRQNRLIERVPTRYGAYWKTYDFKPASGETSNLVLFPLGPRFSANPFNAKAFVQADSEALFNLPNGLQGYLLVNNRGQRIDTAPFDVVEDPDRTSGTTAVVNGLSCMACHATGIKECRDVLRTSQGVQGDELAKVRRLHPEPETLKQYFRKDQERFLAATANATGPFLRVGADRGKRLEDFEEPVRLVALKYLDEVTLEQAARELGIVNPQTLKRTIAGSERLQRLSLGLLADGTPIKRESWEEAIRVQSLFQSVALLLARGTPVLAGPGSGGGVRAELAEAATQIALSVGSNTLRVGDFTGPKDLQTRGGPGITRALADALKKAKAKVEDDGSFVIDGEFTVWRDQETGRLAVRVDLRLKNNQGSVQLLFSRAIFPTDDQDTSIEDLLGSK
jgi:hypothetical protein